MDFSKLTQTEKLAVIGSAAVFLAGIISNWGGLFWLAILAALAMAAIVLLPAAATAASQFGSKGTLMATLGFIAAGIGIIEVLRYIEYFLNTLGRFSTIAFVVALIGAGLMAWAGWQELQAEGGTWRFGAAKGATPAAAPSSSATSDAAASPTETAPATDEPNVAEDRTEA